MNKIHQHISDSIRVKQALLENQALINRIERAIKLIASAFKNGNKILLCGNGGSACDAMHIAEELTGNYKRHRKPLPAIPLTDAGHLTCTANDFGYENVFARAVEAYGKEGDVLLVFSTSGNSKNIVKAIQMARKLSMQTIGFTGETGGEIAQLVNELINVPSSETAHIQEAHITIGHLLIEGIEDQLFFEN